ncbi:FAD-binding oxidoreductase [Streptomonospora nanhaiensis]|uniref:FAD-binding oxidoreductase n=1 Tax=Streptomonospora nanhaiensis TaxID=1323731 RepID=UPI001C38273E|nr:FAD-binding oxidoreductase [Streptomonospora nanhaiensis]MBV2363087.1 FAD-binding protein [Streptomonospora nanhaiensis]MBX9390097.1 FAD-binding protein [Streptomonospora nanhaiensis]
MREATTTTLSERLGAGGAAVREGTAADAVHGRVPRLVAAPPDTAAAAALLAAAHHHRLASVARGNGTAIGWGAPPLRCDLVVDTTALTGIEHAAGDLVVRAGAGTPLAELREHLARAGQRLTLDPLVPGGTVGGAVATGLSGPRRMAHGPLRDLVIGMTVVRADGVAASSGGRVVKNVAGYDLGKLHTGALGTLGLITSVTFRLHPVPPALRLVSAEAPDAAVLQEWTARVLRSAAVPAAVELRWPAGGPPRLEVLLEGSEGGIDARAAEVAALLTAPETADTPPPGWGALPGADRDTLLKITAPVANAAQAARDVRAAARAEHTEAAVGGSAGAGVLYAAVPAAADPAAVAGVVARARDALAGAGGSVTVARTAPGLAGADLDRWGPVGGLGLMRAVKDRFDPHRLLSPGRGPGGI